MVCKLGKYKSFSRYPYSDQDITVKHCLGLLDELNYIDIIKDELSIEGFKVISLHNNKITLRIRFRSMDRTLTKDEINVNRDILQGILEDAYDRITKV